MKRVNTILFLLFLLFGETVIAQNITITGVVSDKLGPVPGASIVVKGTKAGLTTDLEGRFSITAAPNAQLVISCMGYKPVTIDVKGSRHKEVTLHEMTQNLDEVVVVGYGSMKKRDITGAIVSVSAKDIESSQPIDLSTALQGKISGLDIMTSSEPGSSSTFRIRGTSTLSEGGSNPLFVVDGMEVDNIDDLNPRDVASVEVLKDAASTAIYGSRSANGVVIITTKQGESSKPRISVNYALTQSSISKTLPQMNRIQGLEYEALRSYMSGGKATSISRDSLNPMKIEDHNYQDLIFRTAYTHQLDASIAGAEKKVKYYLSLGYLGAEGIQINTYNKRLSSRINVTYDATPRLSIGSRIYLALTNQRKATSESRNRIFQRPANYPIYAPDGSFLENIGNISNPVAESVMGKNDYRKYTANIYEYIQYSFTKNLVLKSSIAANFNLEKYARFRPEILTTDKRRSAINKETLYSGWTHEDVLTYRKKFKSGHDMTLMGGFSLRESNVDVTGLSVTDNITDALEISNTFEGVNMNDTKATWSRNRMSSFFGRASYSYKSRYLFNSNLRYDGSSRFGRDNRWAFFPSVSLGWRFSDEKFLKWAQPVLHDGKLRVSYGVTGNQAAGDFASLGLYTTNYYADSPGIYPNQLSNVNLGWEETKQTNIGLDIMFWDGRISLNVDYYNKKTNDVLYKVPLPQTCGFSSSFKNVGDVENKGWEIAVSSNNIQTKNFSWSTNLSLSFNKNMIVSIPEGGRQIVNNVFLIDQGYAVGTIYGWKAKGIFPYTESNAFTPEWKQLTPVFDEKDHFVRYELDGKEYTGEIKKMTANNAVLEGGDVMWDDVNKDGVIDAEDRQVLGCGQPKVTGGFNNELTYKGLTLSFFFTFAFGGDVYNAYEQIRSEHRWSSLNRGNPINIANSWKAPGDIAKFPRPIGTLAQDNTRAESSLWVEDGSYIRLKNIRLAYTLPKKWAKKIKMESVSVSAMMQNFFTWTNYSGFDPEVPGTGFAIGNDSRSYPRSKELLFGLNVNF
ncbi:SusC/RagA family TonB-linked outer membrane protein [Bacteroides congonensis]|jgi:TonB-linked SusC/RagA family outer membrane protein